MEPVVEKKKKIVKEKVVKAKKVAKTVEKVDSFMESGSEMSFESASEVELIESKPRAKRAKVNYTISSDDDEMIMGDSDDSE